METNCRDPKTAGFPLLQPIKIKILYTLNNQITALEGSLGKVTAQNAQLQQAVDALTLEKQQAATAKEALSEKYTNLRKSAMQLDSFRKVDSSKVPSLCV